MQEIEVTINDIKSDIVKVTGIAHIDGISIPFTVHRRFPYAPEDEAIGIRPRVLVMRSKHGIIEKYKNKDHIKAYIKNKARAWWIDREWWR